MELTMLRRQEIRWHGLADHSKSCKHPGPVRGAQGIPGPLPARHLCHLPLPAPQSSLRRALLARQHLVRMEGVQAGPWQERPESRCCSLIGGRTARTRVGRLRRPCPSGHLSSQTSCPPPSCWPPHGAPCSHEVTPPGSAQQGLVGVRESLEQRRGGRSGAAAHREPHRQLAVAGAGVLPPGNRERTSGLGIVSTHPEERPGRSGSHPSTSRGALGEAKESWDPSSEGCVTHRS